MPRGIASAQPEPAAYGFRVRTTAGQPPPPPARRGHAAAAGSLLRVCDTRQPTWPPRARRPWSCSAVLRARSSSGTGPARRSSPPSARRGCPAARRRRSAWPTAWHWAVRPWRKPAARTRPSPPLAPVDPCRSPARQ